MNFKDVGQLMLRPVIAVLTFVAALDIPSRYKNTVKTITKPEVSIMRKSITIAIILAAVAGALVTVYFYLQRRERELNEYEEILFSDDLGEIPSSDLVDDPIID